MSAAREPEIDIEAELYAILRAVEAAGVPYCLIGGFAAGFHATPRVTDDIDLMTIPEAADAVGAAIEGCGFFESAEPWTFSESGITLRRFAKCKGRDRLLTDLMVAPEGPHREAVEHPERREARGVTFNVIGRDGLILMKKAAGRPQDVGDLLNLGVPLRDIIPGGGSYAERDGRSDAETGDV